MIFRRSTLLCILLISVLGMVCPDDSVNAAPPQFRASLSYSSTVFTPFPGFDRTFISSLTPTHYKLLQPGGSGRDYEINYDFPGRSITYKRFFDEDISLVPVTSGLDEFMARRRELTLANTEYDIRRKSLLLDQRKKAGGLFQFTIPIQSQTFENIFGEGGASLRVSGYRKISFTGRSTWNDKPASPLNRQSKFPSLQMEQIYRFDIEGTIGSKISVKVSQDSRNDLPLANRLILRYRGGEDDVLQTLEAGNTTLNLPSTQFLAYSTRVQGLFGLKATAQIADVSITAIASQEKGSTETMEISAGGSAAASRIVQDIAYKKRTIYDLGRINRMRSRSNRLPEPEKYDYAPGDTVIKVVVYVDDNTNDDAERFARTFGICYIDPDDTTSDDPFGSEFRKEGRFELMDANDYWVNKSNHYIWFTRSPLGTNDLVGVYMEVYRQATGQIDTIGNISSDTLRLKLIKPVNYTTPNNHIWEYEWRNVYSLGAMNLDLNELDVNIYYGKPINNVAAQGDQDVQGNTKYLQIMGLDAGDNNGIGDPDGELDRTVYVDQDYGLLFFPTRYPFDSRFAYDKVGDSMVFVDTQTVSDPFVRLSDSVMELYLSTQAAVVNSSSRYYLTVTTKGRGNSVINLNATNIIEGSEVVTWNGERLIRDQHYRIDPDFGRLTLLDDKFTDVNSNLSVTFERAPFFSLAKKTLFGTRMEYAPNRDFNLGTTILFKSDKSTNRKPKVGEETSKMLVWDVDFSYKFESNFITSMIDALPLISASAGSYVQIGAEFAQSVPNPNVDGDVYIDDFEGSRDSYSLGIIRTQWRKASRPVQVPDSTSERARIAWYNPLDQVPINEIYTNRQIGQGEQTGTNVLDILFKPVDYIRVDTVINDVEVIDTVSVPLEPERSWNGFMRNIPAGVVTQLENAQLLEIRLNGDVGIMHIDLGRITEDIDGNGTTNNEDVDGYKTLDVDIPNGINEDIGLDTVPDAREFGYDPANGVFDPAGDNFDFNDVWRINGTENNINDPDGGALPDTEDPDYDGLDKVDSYFSYTVDLSDTSQFEVPGTRNTYNWRTIRIPLRDPMAIDTMIGDPTFSQIEYARIWFDSASSFYQESPFQVRIAALELVSTTWGDSLFVADSLRSGPVSFDVAVINDEIDEGYTPPPNVEGYFDQTRDVVEAEQSLLLSYENLNARVLVNSPDSGLILAADTGLAVRNFFRSNNFMGYQTLKAFVHGSPGVDQDSVMFFFRLGSDKEGYYEYRTILKPGWDPENFVSIDFNEITGLKAKLLDDYQRGVDSSLMRLDETGKYFVKMKRTLRDPTLTNIQYFAMGVVNLDTTEAASGQVWVDELRLTDVRDDVGQAARVSVNGTMSDLITYNFSYSNQDAFFRGVSSATKGGAADNLGSGATRVNYAFSGSLKLDKFFPRSWELRMPVNFNWSQNVNEPLLRSGTDIIVPEELKNLETAVTVSKGFGVSHSFSKKTKNIIFAGFLNRLSTRFRYNVRQGHSATQPNFFSESYSATATFDFTMRKPPVIRPFRVLNKLKMPFGVGDTKLYLYPTKLDVSGTLTGSYTTSINQNSSNPTTSKLDLRGGLNLGFKIFDNLSGTYTFNTNRDLRDPNTVILTINPKMFKLGVEQSYNQNFRASYAPKLLDFLTHKIDYSAGYTDSYRSNRDSTFYHSATSKQNMSVNFGVNHQLLIGTNKRKRGVRRESGGGGLIGVFGTARTGIRYISDAIKPVSGRITVGRDLSIPGLQSKAELPFRFGLTEDPGVPEVSANTGTVRRTRSTMRSLSAGSGVSLFAGISADLNFGRDVRETFYTSPTKTINETWPEVKLNLRSVRGLWYFGKLLNTLSPSSRFTRTTGSKQRTSEAFPHEERTKNAFSPLISFTINPTRTLRSTVRVEQSVEETNRLAGATGVITDITRRTTSNYACNLSYSFRNPSGIKLPIFGRIRFESSVSLTLDVSYQISKTEGARESGDYVFNTTEDKTNLTIRPAASYSFSSTVKGGLSARWQDSNDAKTRTKRHTRELGLWVEMRF